MGASGTETDSSYRTLSGLFVSISAELRRYSALKLSKANMIMRKVYKAIEASLDERADELIDAEEKTSNDPVEVLKNIIKPLLEAAREGAERENWNAEISYAPNAPPVSELTVEIEFWPVHEERASAASIMAYPDSNEFVDYGLVMTYSVEGSNAVQETQLIPLNRYNPSGACSIIKERIRKALALDSDTS